MKPILDSADDTLKVRHAALHLYICNMPIRLRHTDCSGNILPGEPYVAKVAESPRVPFIPKSFTTLYRYCAHCALQNLPPITLAQSTTAFLKIRFR